MYGVITVDDERWALAGLRKMFKLYEKQFEIIAETTNSIEALDLIRGKKPDAVFTDIRMPDVSGIDLMKIIRSEGIDTEFVIISGFADFSYARESLRLGAFDYCLKPLQLKEADTLLKTLREYLDQKNLKQKNRNDQESMLFITPPTPPSQAEQYINADFMKLLSYVNTHFQKDMSLSGLADTFHLNPTYCSELFKKVTDKTYSEYLSGLRIDYACRLMKLTSMSLEQIAYKAGFNDYYYFCKVFKRKTGKPPSRYRKEKMPENKS